MNLLVSIPLAIAFVWLLWNSNYLIEPALHLRTLLAGILPIITFLPPAYWMLTKISKGQQLHSEEKWLYGSFLSLVLAAGFAFLALTLSIGYSLTFLCISGVNIILFRSYWKSLIPIENQKLFDKSESSGNSYLLFILLSVSFIWATLAALTPPTGYDAHEYHLAVPEQYLQTGAWIQFPYNIYAAFPMNVEMLYLWPLSVESTAGCTVVNFLFAGLTCLAIYCLMNEWGFSKQSWLAVLVFLSTGLVLRLVVQANIDIALACCAALLFYSYERYRKEKNRLDWFLMTIVLGFGLGTKYIAILSLFIPFIALVILDIILNRRSDLIKPMFFVIFCGGLLFLPWLIRNIILYHNPIYPLLSSVFGGNPDFFHALFREAHSPKPATSLEQILTFFWLPIEKSFSTSLTMGFTPLWLFCIPVFMHIKKDHPILRIGTFMFTSYLIWFFLTQRNDRFLATLLPLMAFLAAVGFEFMQYRQIKSISKIVLYGIIIMQLWTAGSLILSEKTINYLFLPSFEDEYFQRHLPHYRAIAELNHLQQEKKGYVQDVLFIGEAQTYGADFNVIAPTVFNHHPLEQGLPPSVTHILYNRSELSRLQKGYGPLGWPLGDRLETWIQLSKGSLLHKIYDAVPEMPDVVVVYEVR